MVTGKRFSKNFGDYGPSRHLGNGAGESVHAHTVHTVHPGSPLGG